MTKGRSEPFVREALRKVAEDVDGLVVYKPPDDARNWKPADFLVWWPDDTMILVGDERIRMVRCAWIEVKQTDAVATWPLNDLRPSQTRAAADAHDAGIPYLILIYWKRSRDWTVVDGVRLIYDSPPEHRHSVGRPLLMSRYGVQSSPGNLASTLKSALLEGL